MIEEVINVTYWLLSRFRAKRGILLACNFETDKYLNLSCIYDDLKKENLCPAKIVFFRKNIFSILSTLWEFSGAKVVVVDCSHWIASKIIFSNKTRLVYIGHGGGVYKKMGYAKKEKLDNSGKTYKKIGQFSYICTTTDKYLSEIKENYHVTDEQIAAVGLPRTDLIFRASNKVKKSQRLTILLAPSFIRTADNTRKIGWNLLEIESILRPIGANIICSIHPDIREQVEIPSTWINAEDIGYPKILLLADVLVTDSSSIMFDYSCTKKPVILFKNNKESLEDNWDTINLETDVISCSSVNELCDCIKRALISNVGESLYENQMKFCSGTSTQKTIKFLKALL